MLIFGNIFADVAQLVERVHGKDEVTGSIPVNGSTGRYRSGQTGQTVNLLALRLRRFEPFPAHHAKTPFQGGFCLVGREGLEPSKAQGQQIYSLPRLTTSVPARGAVDRD